ncbi:hypothetical protein FHS29_007085 [Saccharothrix tamanrassetensis]|uniref:Uncharacterized protein n=1 Tax=Saccharothrix tamanrassetensis TaxID=1051531 RepID=A0A841CRT4_9PSEU|nr:hypothetical protein [Saccharothrix tamanrassetensis]MBB5960461.1 hypothetical protein [Saccharothrix tamanrassetensis]
MTVEVLVEVVGEAAFDEFPRITWRQDAVWRRRAVRSFDDLVADLAAGECPRPRCAAEEMALRLILRCAESVVGDGWSGVDTRFAGLLEHDDDHNRHLNMGDYRPHAWFATFGQAQPRDPIRPFRR